MSDTGKKIAWTVALSIPGAILSVILRRAFQAWGIFNPFADWLGGWLTAHVTAAQAEWTVAALVAVLAYLLLLSLVWRHHSRAASTVSSTDGAALPKSIHEAAEQKTQPDYGIEFGTGNRFETIQHAAHSATRILRVRIKNNTDKPVSNCAIYADEIAPHPEMLVGAALLVKDQTLFPRGELFVDVAAYNEGSKTRPAGDHMRLLIPPPIGFWNAQEVGKLPKAEHLLWIKVMAAGEFIAAAQCRLWIDETGRLRLEGTNTERSASLQQGSLQNENVSIEWLGMVDAINAFCDPELVFRRNRYEQGFQNAHWRCFEIEKEMKGINDSLTVGEFDGRPDALKRYNELQQTLEKHSTIARLSQDGLRDTWVEIRDDLCRRLVSGELTAQGFVEPYIGGRSEVSIRPGEWRILTINSHDSTAVRRSDVSAVVYSGVQIARPTPPPLEIVFDQSNPGKKFWSLEQNKDANGNGVDGFHWEYRVEIRNASPKTLRNVKVAVEAIGEMPTRPEPSYFDYNKQQVIDLDPGRGALTVLRTWYHPQIVAGMVCGGAYGPVKMTVSADDIGSTTKLFWFQPESTPMISEIDLRATDEMQPSEALEQGLVGIDRNTARLQSLVPLKDAAKHVYKEIRGTLFAADLETFGRSPSGILLETARQIVVQGMAWGKLWPSTDIEPVAREKARNLVVLDDFSLANSGTTEAIVSDVCVPTDNVTRFIEYVKKLQPLDMR
ncbi:MAG TPA: hypothetical protein VGU20_12855 [Stellaceae bacterium]|nr:hypothetical protein [Stellaceae bacterium]